jgi:hypothetical protein
LLRPAIQTRTGQRELQNATLTTFKGIAEKRENFGQAHIQASGLKPMINIGAGPQPDLPNGGGSTGAEERSQTFLS